MENTKKKRLTVTKLDLAKQSTGYALTGKFIGLTESKPFEVVDSNTGEVLTKTLTNAVFENPKTSDRFAVIADAGLKNALTDAMVKEGDLIEVVKLDKIKLSRGRTMNQYDIFALQA